MNPAMLLNPKGFAKEKSKEKKARKVPSYGPKQTRKPTIMDTDDETKVVLPTYDPKTLLNPKAASNSMNKPDRSTVSGEPVDSAASATAMSNADPTATDADHQINDGTEPATANSTSLYERHHDVTNRQAPMSMKRKEPDDPREEAREEDHKKQKAVFGIVGRGTVLSEHMRKEREQLNINAPPPVDLTTDNDDNELVFVGANNLSKEVCLGMITVNVNAHAVPHVSLGVAARLGKDFWPQTRVHLNRPYPDQRQIIDVLDTTRKPFGKIDYGPAACLSLLMDASHWTKLRIKAFLKMRQRQPGEAAGQPISRPLRMTLTLYAKREKADKIGSWLRSKSLILDDPPVVDSGIELYNPHKKTVNGLPDYRPDDAVRKVLASKNKTAADLAYVSRTIEEMRREANTMFDKLTKNEDIPEMQVDLARIRTELKPHQKQALHFLIEHERHDFTTSDTPEFSLWKPEPDNRHEQMWYNVITLEKVVEKPPRTRGGILADMMGLGKSLSILSLIAQTNEASKDFGKSEIPQEIRLQDGINSKATLIVCPKSVLASWEEQIRQHTAKDSRTNKDKLTYFIYHGASRTRRVEDLAHHHIVLTSYGTLATDFKNRDVRHRTLMRVNWFRVVLDEAHTIRNATTSNSNAACGLSADRRWAVTGTPIQNRLEDLGALIKFLRVKPFDDPHKWAQYITAPFKMANSDVLQHLRLLIDSITLRRTRDIIELPTRTERIVRLDSSPEEGTIYSAFASQSNLRLQSLVRESKGLRGKSMMHILRSIGRLRMLCAHGREMLSPEDMDEIKGINEDHAIDIGDEPDLVPGQAFVSTRQAYDMLQLQMDGQVADCVFCNKPFTNINNPVVSNSDEDSGESDIESSDDAERRPKASKSKHLMGYLTPCWHLLHTPCKTDYESANPVSIDNYHECPACTEYVRNEYFPLTRSGLNEFLAEKSKRSRMAKKANIDADNYVPHTKVKALIQALQESAEETKLLAAGEPPIRSVVFTEWTTYLDLIEYGLDIADIPHIRLDGSMSLKTRVEVLKRFQEDPSVTVLLISIRAGGQGLNLTTANKVYLMEPQFNPGVEQQAVDRVHRLGQQREVEITHYVMRNTVEEGVLKLQEKKTKLAQLSLGRKRAHNEDVKKKIEELRDLFK